MGTKPLRMSVHEKQRGFSDRKPLLYSDSEEARNHFSLSNDHVDLVTSIGPGNPFHFIHLMSVMHFLFQLRIPKSESFKMKEQIERFTLGCKREDKMLEGYFAHLVSQFL